ncbi:hypothetical protein E4U16_007698 [Claviceps sp. LM84 group G4]|nr:hypothetical protein E4U16_007698 [Claviceps sp. LM84 group G4]
MEFNEEHIEALARPLQKKRPSQAREEDAQLVGVWSRPMSEARQPPRRTSPRSLLNC